MTFHALSSKLEVVVGLSKVQKSKSETRPQPIAVLIGQLESGGGSERQLYMFLANCDRTRWAPVVYVSGILGFWVGPIRKLGIPVVLLRGNPLAKMWQFRSACVTQNAKCFFSWSSYTNIYGLALIGRGGIRCVGSFRNALFTDLPARFRWLWSWTSMASVSTIVCNSSETKTQLASRQGSRKKIVYVPNAVEIFAPEQVRAWREQWRARLGLRDDTVLVLGVGRLAPQKNYARFIDVIARVNRQLPVRCVIAGRDQGCLAELQSQVERLGLQDEVQVLGHVPNAHELMCAADIFLLSSDHEGMPNVVLEAMAAGVPCVSTRVNSIGGLIQHGVTGFIAAHSVDDLAQHAVRLAADAGLRRAVGVRARAAIERGYRQEQILRQLWALCE
jgi:glycosyltransferase involved in cell wall biosynthesis